MGGNAGAKGILVGVKKSDASIARIIAISNVSIDTIAVERNWVMYNLVVT